MDIINTINNLMTDKDVSDMVSSGKKFFSSASNFFLKSCNHVLPIRVMNIMNNSYEATINIGKAGINTINYIYNDENIASAKDNFSYIYQEGYSILENAGVNHNFIGGTVGLAMVIPSVLGLHYKLPAFIGLKTSIAIAATGLGIGHYNAHQDDTIGGGASYIIGTIGGGASYIIDTIDVGAPYVYDKIIEISQSKMVSYTKEYSMVFAGPLLSAASYALGKSLDYMYDSVNYYISNNATYSNVAAVAVSALLLDMLGQTHNDYQNIDIDIDF